MISWATIAASRQGGTERLSRVVFKGETVRRTETIDRAKNPLQ
jgi:hypothetical protein